MTLQEPAGRDLSNLGEPKADYARDLLLRLIKNAKQFDDPAHLFTPGVLGEFEILREVWPAAFSEALAALPLGWKAEILRLLHERSPAGEADASADDPRELDLSALAESEPQPPAFIIPDWLPAGEVTLLAAHGGTGKSATALHLAVCLRTGRDFHGLPVEARGVDFVSFEDSCVFRRT